MARKNGPTIVQEELYPLADERVREELDDARLLDLDAGQESPFLRGQKRVSARRGSLPKKTLTRISWAGLALSILLVCSMAAAGLYHYGERSWRFRVNSSDDIEIAGLQHVTRAQVMEVMGGDIGRNTFFVPLSQRKVQLEQIPWVESASVMRFVPNRLRVEIQERTPVAFARLGSKILLIDAAGMLMDLPTIGNKKYSFPVVLGMNPREPLSTRAPRMKIYNEVVSQLDSGGAHYSQDLSEVDLSDSDDVKVLVDDPQGQVLVHLGPSNYLDRYKIYVAHVQEWRQQFSKLESADLRYDRQIVVNPDLGGTVKQAPLTWAAAKAAKAAGVKPAALVSHETMVSKPAAPPQKSPPVGVVNASAQPLSPAPSAAGKPSLVKPASKKKAWRPARKKRALKRTKSKGKTTPAAVGGAAKPALKSASGASGTTKSNPGIPLKPAGNKASASKKPSPSIAKGPEQNP